MELIFSRPRPIAHRNQAHIKRGTTSLMRLILVSGLSGSGKSTALHVLDDVGFNCIDNLPVSLLPALVAQIQTHHDSADQKFAIGIDVRNAWRDLSIFPEMLDTLQDASVPFHVLFLDTRLHVLIQRYSTTRS